MSAIVNAVRAKVSLKAALIVGGTTVALAVLGGVLYMASKATGGVVGEVVAEVVEEVVEAAVA